MVNNVMPVDELPLRPLTMELVRELWSKTYNHDGKPDWSHIFPYYSENIIFQDSIQRIEGKAEFIALCNRLTQRCENLRMDILSISGGLNFIIFDWVMIMAFKKFPDTPIYGCTKLTLNGQGMIIEQRDYFDLWGDIFNGIPWFHHRYRKFMHKKFG
jgi:limonene-1,2-epoxide hydrolase